MPARFSAVFGGLDRCEPENCGSLAAAAPAGDPGDRRAARAARRPRALPSSAADAPSLSGEALPAVTVPSGRNDRLQGGELLRVTCRARIDSSRARSTPGTATTWSS